MTFRLKTYDAVSSTNLVVKEALASGEAEGLAVLARTQTGGYGRQGRSWQSPEGGLYLSLLLRPQVPMETLSTLSLVLGLAVRRACVSLVEDAYAEALQLKWPNDLVVEEEKTLSDKSPASPFAKLCGISLEAVAGGLCAGIGVNVIAPEDPVFTGGKYEPCFLSDLGCSDADAVCAAVLREVERSYDLWCEQGFAAFLDEYAACDALRGRCVAIADHAGQVTHEGVAEGVDAFGRLLLCAANGEVAAVTSGEAHVLL